MSLSKALPEKARIEIIKRGLLEGASIEEMALECRCSTRTINRDISNLKIDGEFTNWLLVEWIRLYGEVRKAAPSAAMNAITRLVSRGIVERTEIEIAPLEVAAEVKRIIADADEANRLMIREGMEKLSEDERHDMICLMNKMGIDVDLEIRERVLTTS